MALHKKKRTNVSDGGGGANLVARIRKAIETGHFMPNERLVEIDLAEWLNTNRANVRTALGRLEQEGLIVIEPNRGARVRLVSESEAIEIIQTRAALEGLIAREAARKVTKLDIEKLRSIIASMKEAIAESDLLGYSQINGKFHLEIIRIARQETAARLLANLNSRAIRFQFRAILMPGRVKASMAEHLAIFSAIADRNPERAEQAMRLHLEKVEIGLKIAAEAKL